MSLAEKLLPDYSSHLDSALVFAICSEYDDGTAASEDAARATLTALRDAASASTSSHTLDMAVYDDSGSSLAASTLATDDDEVEHAFKNWSDETSESQNGKDSEASYSDDELDPLGFLKRLFPKRDRLELDLALQDAKLDVELAIETLLTEDFLIREEEQEYIQWLTSGEQEFSDQPARRKHRQQGKRGKQTVSLTATPRGHSNKAMHNIDIFQPKPPENVWAKTDSTVLYLATLVGIPPGQLSSLFYQNNNSLPLAMSKLMDSVEESFDTIEDAHGKLGQLQSLFPDRPVSALRRCLTSTKGDVTKAIELFQTLTDLHARQGTPLAHALLLDDNSSKSMRNSALLVHKPNPAAGVQNGRVPAAQKQAAPFERPPSAIDCVTLAFTLRDKRDEAYRNAARTWQRKTAIGNSGVAAYWADHGRQLDRQARQWDLRGARALVDERRTQARTMQFIDLHGLTVSQALTVTQECLVSWWTTPSGPTTFTIITGAGKHSSGQNPVLLPAVKKLLAREGYDVKEGDRWSSGSLTVYGLQGRRKTTAY